MAEGIHLLIREQRGWRAWCGKQYYYIHTLEGLTVLNNWLRISHRCPDCLRVYQEYEKECRFKQT